MKSHRALLALALVVLGTYLSPGRIQAARGIPPSPEFGYGLRIDAVSENLPTVLEFAASLPVDWVALDLDWAALWPDPNAQPDLQLIDEAMGLADRYELAVMLSVFDAPTWARTGLAPDPALTVWFVTNLARRYPETLKTFQLYPGANTRLGWGASPDAAAYLHLVQAAQQALAIAGFSDMIILPGLTPLPSPQPAEEDIDDLAFLQQMYQSDPAGVQALPAIGLTFSALTGSPLQSPSSSEKRVLRHYEDVHAVMLANHHEDGLLWITSFSWPSGKINAEDLAYQKDTEAQKQWTVQAYRQLRSQLYIGAAIFNGLNPSQPGADELGCYPGSNHTGAGPDPFCKALKKLILQDRPPVRLDFSNPQEKHILKIRSGPP